MIAAVLGTGEHTSLPSWGLYQEGLAQNINTQMSHMAAVSAVNKIKWSCECFSLTSREGLSKEMRSKS